MPLTYSTYVQQMANLMAVSSTEYPTDYSFQTFLPGCIDYAEDRIYRETDLLSTRVSDLTATFTANTRSFTLPVPTQGAFLVIEEMNAITPVGATSSGTRVPLQISSRPFIDMAYPSDYTGTGVPQYFAPLSNTVVNIAPVPDQAYAVEVIGTIQPTPLSSTNTTTFLTNYLPDLFIAASMVFASGYMRNFGAQADNPQMAASWEGQYKTLVASAGMQELRKKYSSQGWQNQMPNPIATPPRA